MHDSTGLVRQSLAGARAGARSDAWPALRWGQLPEPEMRSEGLWESLSNSLFAFAQKTFLKKSTARDTARTSGLWRNLSSTCRQVYPAPCAALAGVTQCSSRITLRDSGWGWHRRAATNNAGLVSRSYDHHALATQKWWKSFKKDVLEYSKQQNKKVAGASTAAPSPNRLQRCCLVIP